MSSLDFEVIDWDDVNHMTQEIKAIIQRRQQQKKWLEAYGPTIGLAVVAVIIIVSMYFGYEFMSEAGDRYIVATRDAAALQTGQVPQSAQGPQPAEVTNPLGLDIIPGT